MAFRLKMSYVPALLAMAVAQVALADVITTGTDATNHGLNDIVIANTGIGALGTVQTSFGLTGLNANGNFYSQQTGTIASGQQVFYYSGPNASPVLTGTQIDTSSNLNVQAYATNPVSSLTPTIPNAVIGETAPSVGAAGISTTGAVIATETRGFNTQSNYGRDAYIFIPGSGSTVINDQGILATPSTGVNTGTSTGINTFNGTIYYSTLVNLFARTGPNFANPFVTTPNIGRSASPVGINGLNEVIGSVNRYSGVAETSATAAAAILGTDAFLYNPINTLNPVTIIGLTSGANAFNTTVTVAPNTYTYANVSNTAVAINNLGSVVGTSGRYQSTTSNSSAGTDTWLYTTAGGSQQIGLVGAGATATAVSGISEYYAPVVGSFTFETSGVVAINALGTVAGTATVYASPTSNSTSLGQEAWVYIPVGAGTTATSYTPPVGGLPPVPGAYVQLGVTSIAGQTISTAATPVAGYTNPAGYHFSTVVALNSTGNAVGLSTRYFTDTASTSTGAGTDAYFYDPVSGQSTIITPAASALSNYTSSAGLSSSSATNLFLNNGVGSAAVAAGIQTRYAPGTTTVEGTDGFAYENGHTYVIASPALLAGMSSFSSVASDFASTEDFSTMVTGVNDRGEVIGYFTAYAGSTNATPIGTYYFEWTLAGGTVLLTSTSTAATIDPLSGTLPFATGGLNAFQVDIDGAGNVYGTTSSFSGGTHVFEISAVPEPASLGLLALGGMMLLRRRSKR